MIPDELKVLLTTVEKAADVVEAIDDPIFQSLRGWDLEGWNYVLVPWGVMFTHTDYRENIEVRIEVFTERLGKNGPGEAR